jgi:hypothetical protein
MRAHPPHLGNAGVPATIRSASYKVGASTWLFIFDKMASVYKLFCRAPHRRSVDILRM